MNNAIVASGLGVDIGGMRVLDDITVSLEPGGLACIVGPNGAGKTTLLRCLAGEVRPDDGRVTVGDVAPAELPPPERALRRAFLAQAERNDVPYDVRTVVGFGTHASPLDLDDRDDRVSLAMRHLEVEAVADRRLSSLSGGERKRAAIARTFAQQADVMLLDEPTDSLDLSHADLIMRLCIEYSRLSRTVVVTSHDLNLAARHADRVIVLDRGRIAADGSPIAVFTEELLSSVYRCEVRVMEHPEDGGPLVYL